jgi:hypothetical protein
LAGQFNTMLADLQSNIERRVREEASRREVEGELKAARAIQASLLPAMLPEDPDRDFALHAVNAPAKQVAGDFYDFFFLDDRRLALVMADVAGKGLPAAMYMAVARNETASLLSEAVKQHRASFALAKGNVQFLQHRIHGRSGREPGNSSWPQSFGTFGVRRLVAALFGQLRNARRRFIAKRFARANESDDKSSHSKVAGPGAHLECGDLSPLCLGSCGTPGGDLSPSGSPGQMKASVASLRGVAECCRQILLSKELIDRLAIHGACPVRYSVVSVQAGSLHYDLTARPAWRFAAA